MPRGWYDAQGSGLNIDYGRYVGDGNAANPTRWAVALAGKTDQYDESYSEPDNSLLMPNSLGIQSRVDWPEVEDALKSLNSIIPLLGDDDEMRKHHGFSMTEYVMDRQALGDTFEAAAKQMDKVSYDTGIARTTGGGVGIASGIAIIGGILAAPFSGGTSLALTLGGLSGGVAGAATTFTASTIKESNLQEEVEKIRKSVEKIDEREKVVTSMINTMGTSLETIRQYVDDKTSLERVITFGLTSAKTVGWNVAYGSVKTYKSVQYAKFARATANFIQADIYAMKGIAAGAGLSAPGLAIPGFIPRIGGKVLITAGSTTAKVFSGAFAVLGIGFGIYDVVEGVNDINSSEDAQKFREMRKEYAETTAIIAEHVYSAQCSVAGGQVETFISDMVKVNGQNVKKVVIDDGDSFVNVDGLKWAQFDSEGNERFIFSQLARDEWSVYLKDEHERSDGSKMVLQVDLYLKKVFWCNRDGIVNYNERKVVIASINSVSKI
eukprot:scaffold23709_cov86-Skeletonema_dohrnii-CCMP3373.AAC.7